MLPHIPNSSAQPQPCILLPEERDGCHEHRQSGAMSQDVISPSCGKVHGTVAMCAIILGRGSSIPAMGTSITTGPSHCSAAGSSVARSMGSSALMPVAPNDSANTTQFDQGSSTPFGGIGSCCTKRRDTFCTATLDIPSDMTWNIKRLHWSPRGAGALRA